MIKLRIHKHPETHSHLALLNNAACECCEQRVCSIQIRHPVTFPQPPVQIHMCIHLHMHTSSPYSISKRRTLLHPADSDSVFNVATLSCHISFLSATPSLSLPSLYSLCCPIFSLSPLPSLHPINNCWHFLPQLRKKQLKAIDPGHTLMHERAPTHTGMHALLHSKHTPLNTHTRAMNMQVVLLDLQRQGKARWLHSSWDCHWICQSAL